MGTRSNYQASEVTAARQVLIELMQILGEYRNQMVIVGGWVPYLLFGSEHIGSTDIDIALDKDLISNEAYRTIREHLEQRGYREGKQPFTFLRDIQLDHDRKVIVHIDFLASEYGGTGKRHRTQRVQDMHPRKARGCELALQHHTQIVITGKMPDGSSNRVEVQLSHVVPFLVMKGMALYDRLKEKDSWDVYFCIVHFPTGINALADEIRTLLPNHIVEEGLQKIRSKFLTLNSTGPRQVAAFEEVTDPDEIARIQRDAFERVNALLDSLDIKDYTGSL
jgi:hypothetical protein